MKLWFNLQWKLAAAIVFSLGCLAYGDAGKSPQPKAAWLVPQVPEVEIPQSTFVIPSQPTEGRNPFYPQSNTGFQAPPVNRTQPTVVDTSSFVLNGLTSPPRRTAMINGRTFERGETGEVKLPNGSRALIKCEEIANESAVILVNGQRREIRLRSGL